MQNKRIGIDARLYFQTGVGVYIRNFLHYLQQQPLSGYDFFVYILEKDSSQIQFENKQFIKREVHSKWHSLSEQLAFYQVLMRDNLDLMHFTYFSYPVLYRRPFIATIHDVTPLIFKTGKASTLPGFLYEAKHSIFKYVMSQQMKNSCAVITPTHAVKKQLIEIYGSQYESKITPIYEGINYEFFNAVESQKLTSQFTKPFYLYVGNFYPHKNVERLIEAFVRLKNNDVALILVGPNNYFSGLLEQEISQKNYENITMYHPTHANDLLFFYKRCIALINPSLSEGFGLPLVEAAYCGSPIMASDIEVFREILGDNALYFDPLNTASITESLAKGLHEKELKKSILDKKFSFEQMVQKYLKLLKTIIE